MKKQTFSHEELSQLCLSLSLLLHSGISMGDSLVLLSEEDVEDNFRILLSQIARQVDDGVSLASAFRGVGCFPDYVCGLLEMGERSGHTEEALSALARYYSDRALLDRRLRAALLYPAMLLLIMLAVIVILLARVLPVFNQVYSDLGGRLTGVAGGLLALGQVLDRSMPVLCAVLALVVLFLILFSCSSPFRDIILTWWQKGWGDRGISRKMNTARFAQSLSMGLNSGLPLEEALSLSAGLLAGVPTAQARCRDCLSRLEQGIPLAKAMAQSGVLPQAQCRLLDLGLSSGSGDITMEQIAQRLSEESELALETKVSQVEPTLVIVTSVLVGLILLSVMLPLMHIMTAIG